MEKKKNTTKAKDLKPLCTSCGKVAAIDKTKSNKNWTVYDITAACECGNKEYNLEGPAPVNKGGRPTKRAAINKKISESMRKGNDLKIKKLEEAFAFDATVPEACFYAGISEATYYNWIKENPKLLERFEALRNTPILLARKTVVQRLGDSYGNAIDYLSRKRKNEFSQRVENINADMTVKEFAETFTIDDTQQQDDSKTNT